MVDRGVQFEDAVREFEKRFISRVLGCCDGSLTKTADELGIHRNTLTRKMGDAPDQEKGWIGRKGSLPLLSFPPPPAHLALPP